MLPESRGRLVRAVGVAGTLGVFLDEPERSLSLFEPMVAGRTAGVVVAREPVGSGRGDPVGTGVLGTPRRPSWPGRNMFAAPSVGIAQSVLPSWYPRTRITSVSRAYEMRRAQLLETEGRQADIPATAELSIPESSDLHTHAPLEHDVSLCTPAPAVAEKPRLLSIGKVPEILRNIINKNCVGESEFLPPQRKLLNEIDLAKRLVMKELRRLERTPDAKKSERQKKVRILMSMR